MTPASLELVPFEACGPLKRGLPFDGVRAMMGPAAKPFRKASTSDHDALDVGGRLHVFFDGGGGCTGVEVFTDSGLTVTCAGVELSMPDATALVSALVELGQHWEVDTYGVRAPMLGLATFHTEFDWDAGARQIDALYLSLDPDFVP